MLLILKILIFIENLLVALLSQLLHGSANPIGGQSAIEWKDKMMKCFIKPT
jgi:hypothetical protein